MTRPEQLACRRAAQMQVAHAARLAASIMGTSDATCLVSPNRPRRRRARFEARLRRSSAPVRLAPPRQLPRLRVLRNTVGLAGGVLGGACLPVDGDAALAWLGLVDGHQVVGLESRQQPVDQGAVHGANNIAMVLGERAERAVPKRDQTVGDGRLVAVVLQDAGGIFEGTMRTDPRTSPLSR